MRSNGTLNSITDEAARMVEENIVAMGIGVGFLRRVEDGDINNKNNKNKTNCQRRNYYIFTTNAHRRLQAERSHVHKSQFIH